MPTQMLELSPNYAALLTSLRERIRSAQTRAAMSVNRELVLLYWQIGSEILIQQDAQGWGARVIDRLSHDLRQAFPCMKGFSARNLKYMRAFAEAWPDEQFVQQPAAQMPWFHNCVLLDKLSAPDEREWYARKAIENGWSRNISKPIGVSAYQLTRALPEGLKGSMPTIEELETELTPASQAG